MRGVVSVCVLFLVVVSGCLSKADTTTGTGTTSASVSKTATSTASRTATASPTTGATATGGTTTGTTTASTETTTAAPAPNAPPTATLASANTTGAAPFNVTFTASGTDPDSAALTWTLTYGDGSAAANGTTLPANVTHAYTTVGNFTARLTVSDGTSTANATLLVHAQAPPAGIGPGHDPNCQRSATVTLLPAGAALYYLDDRGNPVGGYVTGDGDWVYKETNGIPGLQLDTRPAALPAPLGGPSDVDTMALQFNCVGGDELQF